LGPGRTEPLRVGCGVSNLNDPSPDAGTLGAIVRYNIDGTRGILSANHVIADNNGAHLNDPVYQPAELDWRRGETAGTTTFGRLKRFVRINETETVVDAAIAQIEAPEEMIEEEEYLSTGGVEPPSINHPAVGMIVAGDGFGNVWLTSMATTLERLNATLKPETRGNVEATAPSAGSKLDKVGRTTGATVGRVLRTGESVRVEVEGVGVVRYTGLIKVSWLGWFGDSGAMVLRKAGPERFRAEEESVET
jgi:hypothetical protein